MKPRRYLTTDFHELNLDEVEGPKYLFLECETSHDYIITHGQSDLHRVVLLWNLYMRGLIALKNCMVYGLYQLSSSKS